MLGEFFRSILEIYHKLKNQPNEEKSQVFILIVHPHHKFIWRNENNSICDGLGVAIEVFGFFE